MARLDSNILVKAHTAEPTLQIKQHIVKRKEKHSLGRS